MIPNDWETRIKWNVKLFYLINNKRFSFLDKFYKYYYYMGKSYSLPIYIFIFWYFSGIKSIYALSIGLLITGILMPSIKYTFKHKRPSSLLKNVNLLEPVSLKSFPSADTAYAFTIFAVSLFFLPIYIVIILLINAFIISYGRIYMGAHFPIDVIVGALIGFFDGVIANLIIRNILS